MREESPVQRRIRERWQTLKKGVWGNPHVEPDMGGFHQIWRVHDVPFGKKRVSLDWHTNKQEGLQVTHEGETTTLYYKAGVRGRHRAMAFERQPDGRANNRVMTPEELKFYKKHHPNAEGLPELSLSTAGEKAPRKKKPKKEGSTWRHKWPEPKTLPGETIKEVTTHKLDGKRVKAGVAYKTKMGSPMKTMTLVIVHEDGTTDRISAHHPSPGISGKILVTRYGPDGNKRFSKAPASKSMMRLWGSKLSKYL